MSSSGLDIEVLGIDLLVPDAPTALEVRELCVLALASAGIEEGHMAVEFVDADRIQALNREYRGIDRPTDVLSFPAAGLPGAGGPALLGDLAISLDTAARRARAEDRPLAHELDRYLAHGLLHLLGHDHHRPRERRAMAAAEEALLRGEGMIAAAGPGSRSRSGSRR